MARGFRAFRREPSNMTCLVTYWVDVGVSYTEKVALKKSVLSPQSFTPTKTGYTFLGWKESGIASADVLVNKVAEGKTMTLYAVFTKAVTVTYYNNSATASTSTKEQYYNNGDILNPTFNLTVASVSGWTARGWSTGSGASATITYNSATNFTRDSNITLYASWSRTVTVSYNGNGATSGSTSASTGTAYRGYKGDTTKASITLRANGFAKTDNVFVRWRLNSTSGTAYNAGSTYSSTADATMYAEWSLRTKYYYVLSYQPATDGFFSYTVSKYRRYSNGTNALVSTTSHNYASQYGDSYLSCGWGRCQTYRNDVVNLVAGSLTASGSYNNGSDYGKAGYIVPYQGNGNSCTVYFLTSSTYP